jgi:WD40 repeat protein
LTEVRAEFYFHPTKDKDLKMRNNCVYRSLLVALTLAVMFVVNAVFAQEQTAINSIQSSDKLTVTLKAKLPDYKGPSRFVGRKALITFSPDGSLAAMSGKGGSITIWDTETGALKATLKNGKDEVSGFAFSSDGRMAATRDYLDKSVRLWDVSSWQLKATIPGRKRNLETRIKSGFSFEEEFGPVAFSPDGGSVLSEREDDVVTVSDVPSGQERMTLKHDTRDSGVKETAKVMLFGGTRHFLALQTGYSTNGRWIFTINGDKSAKIWDAADGRLKTNITNNERIYRAGFSPDGSAVLTVEQEGGMKLWDIDTGELRGQVAPKGLLEGYMKGFEFAPDGRTIATFSQGDTRLWNVKTGELLFKLPKSEGTDVNFSPDGHWLATAANDKQTAGKIWNVETGELKLALPPIGYKTASVIFNSNGTILATTNDKGVMLWDPQTGTLLARLDEARYPVAFSREGRTLVTGGRNDTALLWKLELFTGTAGVSPAFAASPDMV